MQLSEPPNNVGEERIEARRYLDAVRRHAVLIAVMAALAAGAAYGASSSLEPTYLAQVKIVFEEPTSGVTQTDAAAIQMRLATLRQLLTSPRVLAGAGEILGDRDGSLGGSVSAAVDSRASILSVIVKHEQPKRAAAIANAVASAFLADRAQIDRRSIETVRRAVQQQIDDVSASPNREAEVGALRQRLSELGVAESAAGKDLQIAESAQAPSDPIAPRPLRNAVLAMFGAIFLGILIALARDQLAPRLSGPRELSRILELPMLVGVPHVARRGRNAHVFSAIEDEAYQTLRATLEFSARGKDHRVVLVTGALPREGKTSATARLGRALARAGHKTLIVSADLRVPKLHQQFGLPLGLGLADILAMLDWEGENVISPELLTRATNVVVSPATGKGRAGYLHLITSGTTPKDPARLVSSSAMRSFLEEVRGKDYDYILVDGPPLLGIADSQVIAQWVDTMLVVSRLDRTTAEHASELRDVLDRLDTRALGFVLIGVHADASPYYLTSGSVDSGDPGVLA